MMREGNNETRGIETMTTITITAKMSNSGTIHDLASDMFDRVIEFRAGTRYAVIIAAYYGGKGYTTHRTEGAAAAESRRQADYSHAIIDCEGGQYIAQDGELVPDGELAEAYTTG